MEIMEGAESEDGPLHLEETDEEAESTNTKLPLPAAFLDFLKTNELILTFMPPQGTSVGI